MTLNITPSLPARLWVLGERAILILEQLQPAAQLLARWFVAGVFFRSGLTKLREWDTTLALFTGEYHVPRLRARLFGAGSSAAARLAAGRASS